MLGLSWQEILVLLLFLGVPLLIGAAVLVLLVRRHKKT
jgi:hypothetical protein